MALQGDVAAPAVKGGLFEDIIDIFVRPKVLYERNRNNSFVRPALVQSIFMLVVTVATLSLISPYYEAEMLRAMRQSGQTLPDGASGAMGTMAKVTPVITAVIAPWLIALLGGLATWIGARIAGAKISFGQSAMIASWSFMPAAILGVLSMAIQGAMTDSSTIRGAADAQIGPARFVDPETTPKVLMALYQQLDIFNLWLLALTALGVMVVARKDLGTGILATIIRFAIVACFTIIPALLASSK